MALFTAKEAPRIQGGEFGVQPMFQAPVISMAWLFPGVWGEGEGAQLVPSTHVELILELHPGKERGMRGALGGLSHSPDPNSNPSALRAHQCRRRAWRKAESPSITSRMATVSTAKAAKTGTSTTPPT